MLYGELTNINDVKIQVEMLKATLKRQIDQFGAFLEKMPTRGLQIVLTNRSYSVR